MDPSRKRAIRLTVALSAALLLATALIYVSFNAGRDEFTASQLLEHAQPGGSYILAGRCSTARSVRTVRRCCSASVIRKQDVAVPVRYTGVVPDPFAAGRAVMVNVNDDDGTFVGQQNSLTTKCPSKYVAASGAYN